MINLDEIRDEQIAEKRRRPDPMLWALEMGLHSGLDQIDRYEGLIWIPPKLQKKWIAKFHELLL
jgi:hypothetical protein